MRKQGYTPAVRALLEKPYIDLGAMMTIEKEYACYPKRSAWACEVLGLQDDPVWDFLRAKAVEVLWYEALVSIHHCRFSSLRKQFVDYPFMQHIGIFLKQIASHEGC